MTTIPGPRGPLPVARDAWGTPRVGVRDAAERAWAVGWLHATDRRLQCELTRLVGEGRLMEVVGDRPFARQVDRACRLLGFGLGLEEASAALGGDVAEAIDAYVQGFNAASWRRGAPLAWRALGLEARPWDRRAVLLTYRVLAWFGLTSTTQLARLVVAELGAEGASEATLRALLGPGAEGLDLEAMRALRWPGDDALVGLPDLGGSNAFAVSGRRTASGGAVMLAEFHLEIGHLPPVMYPVDLRQDDGDYLLGFTAPGMPWVLAGRTREIGWTYTFGHADNIDVTLERCQDGRVLRPDGPVTPTVRRVEAAARGRPRPVRWTLYDLPDGSTLLGDPAAGVVPAVRWRGLADAVADHAVLCAIPRQRSVAGLVALHRGLRVLAAGAVFGDRAGGVAWMHTGVVTAARRGWGPRWGGGDDAPVPERERPVSVDPPEGYVAAANEAVPGWTAFHEPRYRRERLDHHLRAGEAWDEEAAAAVTRDPHDGCAARLLAVWGPLLPEEPGTRALIAWGARQDGVDRDAARHYRARFHALHHEACRALMGRLVGLPVARRVLDELGQLLALQDNLDAVLAGERPELLDRDGLREVLAAAWPRSLGVQGPALTFVTFTDPITEGRLPGLLGFHKGPILVDGGPTSLFQARQLSFLGQRILGGPAFHLVMDLGRDGALYDVAGGASERRFGPGYGAGLEAWAAGELAPIGPRG